MIFLLKIMSSNQLLILAREKIDNGHFFALSGGLNSAIYLVQVEGSSLVSKRYCEIDAETRFLHEVQFLSYCELIDCRLVPKLVARNDSTLEVLLEFIQGKSVSEISEDCLIFVSSFLLQLNSTRLQDTQFVFARDALVGHHSFATELQTRMDALKSLRSSARSIYFLKTIFDAVDSRLSKKDSINAAFRSLISQVVKSRGSEFIISPSDLGIHNMIKTQDGLRFIDFEYAGLDSPIKLFGDFVSHPRHIVNANIWREFHRLNENLFGFDFESFSEFHVLLFRLKWCLIMSKRIDLNSKNSQLLKLESYFQSQIEPLL